MDDNLLSKELTHIIKIYHASNVRYKHFAVSSRDMAVLSPLSHALQDLLPEYCFWSGEQAELNNAPSALCSRSDFVNAVFNADYQGLIIYQPAYWLQRWRDSDKQAFWSALSARHGGHNVIVIMPESDEFKRLNLHYFTPQPMDNLPITLWVSSKKQLF